MRHARESTGFTLIEVLITVGIFAVIMVAVNSLYLSGTRTYGQSVTVAQMRIQTQRAVQAINNDLIDCRILDGGNLLDQLNFQKPTPRMRSGGDPATDKRYINTSNDQVFWGDGELEIDGSAEVHVGNYIKIEFVLTASISEAADGLDYNDDGDRTDTFERGRLMRSVYPGPYQVPPAAAPLSQRSLTSPWVFKAAVPVTQPGVPGPFTDVNLIASMDLDRANGPDPLFLLVDDAGGPAPTGGHVQVRVFSMRVIDRFPVKINCASLVTPINR